VLQCVAVCCSVMQCARSSLQLHVLVKGQIFLYPKEPSKRDDILQKRTIILRSLLHVATPYLDKESVMLRDVSS